MAFALLSQRLSTGSADRPAWPVVWWHAMRPRTLPLSVSPVLAGSALGWIESGVARPDLTALAALSAMAIQVGTNLHNDAADSLNGTDRSDRQGPPRVTERGWVDAAVVLRAAHLAFALAALGGLGLIFVGGLPIIVIGLLSILAGYAYSAGPWPISRGPLGEVFVILFFGLIAVGGVFFLYTGGLTPAAVLLGLINGLLAAAVLLVNNTRDRDQDHRAGRRTLAILISRTGAIRLYTMLLAASYGGLVVLAGLQPGLWGALLGLVSLPMAGRALAAFRRADNPASFNQCLARTAALQGGLCLATCAGLLLTGL